jgi:hypothetical protein
VQYGPNKSLFLVPIAKMKRVSPHELGANQSFGCGEAEWGKRNAVRLQDRSFQIGEGGKADIKIRRDNQKLLQLMGCPFADGGVFGAASH